MVVVCECSIKVKVKYHSDCNKYTKSFGFLHLFAYTNVVLTKLVHIVVKISVRIETTGICKWGKDLVSA